jgi:hypothetical protein
LVFESRSEQRQFALQWVAADHYTVLVDRLPWQLQLQATGCEFFETKVAANQRLVRAVLTKAAPKPDPGPMARILGTVLDPDGKPARLATIHLHGQPDLDQSSDETTASYGCFLIVCKPGGRVCVRASQPPLAPDVVGPIELTPGDQEVTLQLRRPLAVRGVLVDAEGKPVKGTVCLRRPAEALRDLADGVPEILPRSGNGDSLVTGDDGMFSFETLGPGEHELWAVAEAGGWPARRRVRGGEQVTLRMGEGTEGLVMWKVQVTDAATGATFSEVDLQVTGAVSQPSRPAAGAPIQVVVRPGDLAVRGRARDHVVRTEKVRVDGPDAPLFELKLLPSPLRFLRVVDESGAPVARAQLSALDARGEAIDLLDAWGNEQWMEATDGHGRAVVRGLPIGALKVSVKVGEAVQLFEVPATGGRETVFDLTWRR